MKKISVLVIDDSTLMRNLISKIIENDHNLTVVGKAINGIVGLKKTEELKPDVITLDLEMPEMDGIAFLKEVKSKKIDCPIIILSSLAKTGAAITMQALNLGACDFVLKPSGAISLDIEKIAIELCEKIQIHHNYYQRKRGETRLSFKEIERPILDSQSNYKNQQEAWPRYQLYNFKITKPRILCIGASTGGPVALRFILSKFSPDFPLPILIVQHMPKEFIPSFTHSLDTYCQLKVVEAQADEPIKAGKVYIAPGNQHMRIVEKSTNIHIELSHTASLNGHRPSVDILFSSVAKVYQGASIAVLMTGMGKDGAKEIGTLFNKGAFTIAQDEFSCVVYGMPKAAVEHGYIHTVLPLGTISKKISEIIKTFYTQ